MIRLTSDLPRSSPDDPYLVEYSNRIKQIFVKGTSNRIVPDQDLEIITKTFILDITNYFQSIDIVFREL